MKNSPSCEHLCLKKSRRLIDLQLQPMHTAIFVKADRATLRGPEYLSRIVRGYLKEASQPVVVNTYFLTNDRTRMPQGRKLIGCAMQISTRSISNDQYRDLSQPPSQCHTRYYCVMISHTEKDPEFIQSKTSGHVSEALTVRMRVTDSLGDT